MQPRSARLPHSRPFAPTRTNVAMRSGSPRAGNGAEATFRGLLHFTGTLALVGSAPASKARPKPATPVQLFLISSSVKTEIKGPSNLIPGLHLRAACTSPSCRWQISELQADAGQIPGLRWKRDPHGDPSHVWCPLLRLLHSLLGLIGNCTSGQGGSTSAHAPLAGSPAPPRLLPVSSPSAA